MADDHFLSGKSGCFLLGDLGATPACFREPDSDCLLAAFHLPATAGFQLASFQFVHLLLDARLRLGAVFASLGARTVAR